MKALILAPFAPVYLEGLRRRMSVIYEPWTETLKLWDPAELAARLAREDIEAVIAEVDFFFDEVFQDPCPLKFIGLCRQGTNHVDSGAAAERGVTVINTPGRSTNAVAELVIGLALSLVRRIPAANAYVRGHGWENPLGAYLEMRGSELAGKTIGIVGIGAVGLRVARLARSLGMRVLAYDPYTSGPRFVRMTTLEHVLAASDVVTLHAPETEETRGMLHRERLALMSQGSFLINTASAALVDEAALVDALRSGRLAGAGLDVFETHPIMPNNPLLTLDNVVLTPHLGGATAETVGRYSQTIARRLLQFEREVSGKRRPAA